MEWTDEQLDVILKCFSKADNGCSVCVRSCIGDFIRLNGNDLSILNKFESMWPNLGSCNWGSNEWKDVCPNKEDIEE